MKTNLDIYKMSKTLHDVLKRRYPEYYKKIKKLPLDMTAEQEDLFINDFKKFLRKNGFMSQLH